MNIRKLRKELPMFTWNGVRKRGSPRRVYSGIGLAGKVRVFCHYPQALRDCDPNLGWWVRADDDTLMPYDEYLSRWRELIRACTVIVRIPAEDLCIGAVPPACRGWGKKRRTSAT